MAKPETLKKILNEQCIDTEIIEKINNGYEKITDKSPKKKKAEYLFHAVTEMDLLIDRNKRQKIMELCACTINSSGLNKTISQFAKKTSGLSLKDKIIEIGKIKHLGNPVLRKDGTIIINLADSSGYIGCPCPQISGIEITHPVSFTYCMCCGGHLKYQYENALDIKVNVKIESTVLKSMDKKPCVFILEIIPK